jgi:hypothetical protein
VIPDAGSAQRKSGGAKGRLIGVDPPLVAPNELGPTPSRDRELRTRHHETLSAAPGVLRLALLLVGEPNIGEAEPGTARMISLKGGDRFVEPPGMAVSVPERARKTGG